jgi:hypothetical protein
MLEEASETIDEPGQYWTIFTFLIIGIAASVAMLFVKVSIRRII